jgi:hypothetical protein
MYKIYIFLKNGRATCLDDFTWNDPQILYVWNYFFINRQDDALNILHFLVKRAREIMRFTGKNYIKNEHWFNKECTRMKEKWGTKDGLR